MEQDNIRIKYNGIIMARIVKDDYIILEIHNNTMSLITNELNIKDESRP